MNIETHSASRFPVIIAWILHLLPWALVVAELICVGVYAAHASAPRKISPASPAVLASTSPVSSSAVENPSGFFTSAEFPEGRLFVTAARGAYQDGAMQLFVPKLGAEGLPVRKTSDDAVLRSEVGLSEFSQMPAENLGNVIILGWGGFAEPPDGGAASEPASGAASSDAASSGAASSGAASSGAASSGAASSGAASSGAASSGAASSGAASSDAASSDAASSDAASSDAASSDAASSDAASSDAASSDAASSGAASSGAAASSAASSSASIRTVSSSAASQPAPFTPRSGKFKGLETLSFGDDATLTYDGTRYSYAYKDTQTFEEDDWAPLYIQGFNCLSLVSPVGNGQSVVVRFELSGTEKL